MACGRDSCEAPLLYSFHILTNKEASPTVVSFVASFGNVDGFDGSVRVNGSAPLGDFGRDEIRRSFLPLPRIGALFAGWYIIAGCVIFFQ
jgi:hypothetical protein